MVGRKLDLSGLSEAEAQHVLHVVQRDMRLREKEEARLSEMKQELEVEGSRSSLLSRQHHFNERCCIRCCCSFTFLFNPKRPCLDCHYNVCKGCCTYSRRDSAWLCSTCQKSRLLKTQSLEWYYNNVRRRFKRFGSAKVLKTLYRKHTAEQGNLAAGDLTEESTYAESTGNEGSICDSDSAFYKQIEEHNMADTITVALRVAEEAIDEAITKAEAHTDSQEKQREAQYLRDNREELIEELATTIVHKIIRRRRDLSDLQGDYHLDWPHQQSHDQEGELLTCTPDAHSSLITSTSLKSSLWRSRSAFSLLTDGAGDLYREAQNQEGTPTQPPPHGLKKDGMPILPTWKSVDRLDNSSASTVLQSPDGNWIALQSTLLSRPSLLAKRKSLVFSMLEKESDVVSAYDEMGSDTELEQEGAWGALLEFRRKMKTTTQGATTDTDTAGSDQDGGGDGRASVEGGAPGAMMGVDGAKLRYHKPLLSLLKQKPSQGRRRTPPRRPSIIDMNFNPDTPDSSEVDEEQQATPTRNRRRRRSKREHHDDVNQPHASLVPEYSTIALDDLVRMRNMRMQERGGQLTSEDGITSDTETPDILSSGNTTPEPFPSDLQNGRHKSSKSGSGNLEQDLTSRLQELASKVTHLSSTEDELDRSNRYTAAGRTKINSAGQSRSGSRESVAREALWDMEVEGDEVTTTTSAAKSSTSGDGLAEMDIDMEEVKEEGQKYILSVRAKVLELETRTNAGKKTPDTSRSRPTSSMSVEHKWWESLGDSSGRHQAALRRSNTHPYHHDYDSQSDGLDGVANIDEILSDMVRSSEIEIEKSNDTWDRVEDKIEDMDVGEDRESTEVEDAALAESWDEALSDRQDDWEWNPGVEIVSGRDGGKRRRVQDAANSDRRREGDVHHNSGLARRQGDVGSQRYSAASLRSVTTEMLRVLNATEELLQGVEAGSQEVGAPNATGPHSDSGSGGPAGVSSGSSLSPGQSKKLNEQLSKLEENVYVAASTVYGLEGELGDLEACARRIGQSTTERELAQLEDQVASAAAQVQQSELQVTDIAARIAALKTAGLNVAPQSRLFRPVRPLSRTQTIDTSRQQRRRLPAPPTKEKEAADI